MLQMILPEGSSSLLAFFGILFAFGATVLATAKLSPYLRRTPEENLPMMENCPRESQEAPESFLCWHLWHLFYCLHP